MPRRTRSNTLSAVGGEIAHQEGNPYMDVNKPISGEFAAMLPALADTMRFAAQALAQSAAVYEVMIAKGLATREELEVAMSPMQGMSDKLASALDQGWQEN